MKKFKEIAINNDCLGHPELQWVQSWAATYDGTLPKMPIPTRKLCLNRGKFIEWENLNREYLSVKEEEYHHRLRYIKNDLDRRAFIQGWKEAHQLLMVLRIIVEDNAVNAQRNYYGRVRSPTSQEGGTYTKHDIEEIRLAQGNRCEYFRYCGTSFEEAAYHIDHIVPVRRGGDNTRDNLQLLCRSCNTSKKDMSHAAFVKKLKERRQL